MSKFAYTTALSQEILNAYTAYQQALKFHGKDHRITNATFIHFANACEKEGKTALSVIQSLA